jgi:hypothetical protein
MSTSPIHSPYGGFSEGDHVTRDGTDVHLVKDMTPDGFAATFVCVVAPATKWITIGEEEHNLCRRYTRLKQTECTQQWSLDPEQAPGAIHPEHTPASINEAFKRAVADVFGPYIQKLAQEAVKVMCLKVMRHSRASHYTRKTNRRPKRRSMRK